MKVHFNSFVGALLVLWTAQVATAGIDFGQYAINTGERGYAFGHVLAADASLDGFGISVFSWNTSTGIPILDGTLLSSFDAGPATITSNTVGPYAYMDGLYQGRKAGLGVAQKLTDTFQAVDPGDDNITVLGGGPDREVAGLQFFETDVVITDFVFRDADHYLINDVTRMDNNFVEKVDITFDGGLNWGTYDIGDDGLLDFGPSGIRVSSTDQIGIAYNNHQLYLSAATAAAVPEAAAVAVWALMGLTVGGCYRWRRRREA